MTTEPITDRILVPLDGSDRGLATLPWARALASDTSELILLHVVTNTVPLVPMAGVSAELYDEALRAEQEAAVNLLAGVAGELAGVAGHIDTVAHRGFPADEILEISNTHRATMILMATQGRGATGRLIVGSVADRVARAATAPVMLVHAGDDEPDTTGRATCGRLVTLLDGSDRARAALPVATDLARRLDAPLHLLRVVPTREATFTGRDSLRTGKLHQRLVRTLPTLPQVEVDDDYWEQQTGAISAALASEASRLAASGVEATSELRVGETVPSIFEAQAGDDVIVMTSHGEGGIRRWMLGSVAEQLIHQAVAPVVLVPNPGREGGAEKSPS